MSEQTVTLSPFRQWLDWLDSDEGRQHRLSEGQEATDLDIACLIPTPPGRTIFTVGDVRALAAKLEQHAALLKALDSLARAVGKLPVDMSKPGWGLVTACLIGAREVIDEVKGKDTGEGV